MKNNILRRWIQSWIVCTHSESAHGPFFGHTHYDTASTCACVPRAGSDCRICFPCIFLPPLHFIQMVRLRTLLSSSSCLHFAPLLHTSPGVYIPTQAIRIGDLRGVVECSGLLSHFHTFLLAFTCYSFYRFYHLSNRACLQAVFRACQLQVMPKWHPPKGM